MSWWINVLIAVLALVLVVLIVVRLRLKQRLDSIDGFVGIAKAGEFSGKVIGGELTKVYRHNSKKS